MRLRISRVDRDRPFLSAIGDRTRHPPGEDALVGSRRSTVSTVSNGYRASCADRTRQVHRATLKHYDKPLQSMKTIPLDTRGSSRQGLQWDLGKKGSGRAIQASVGRKRPDMPTARFSSREAPRKPEIDGS